MAFNVFTIKWLSYFGQYDRIDDLITRKLSGDECSVFRQFLVDEFYSSAVFKGFDPLFVWHVRISSGEIRVYREYTLFGSSETTPLISSQLRGACFYALGDTQILPQETAVRRGHYL